jgi:hypothetical protein
VALALLLAFTLFLYSWWPSPVTRENFDRLHPGMTKDEVIAILRPPGDYRNAENEYDMSPAHQPPQVFGRGNPHFGMELWRSDTADVALNFDDTDKVSSGIFCYMRATSHNPLYNLQWRAQHRWRHWLSWLDNISWYR